MISPVAISALTFITQIQFLCSVIAVPVFSLHPRASKWTI